MNTARVYDMKHARQKQEDPLNLQSLPMVLPPRDGWPAVEAALRRDLRRRSLQRFGAVGLAAAATVALVLGLQLRGPLSGVDPAPGPGAVDATGTQLAAQPPVADSAASQQATGAAQREDTLEAMVGLSQQLEARLRLLRIEGGRLPAAAVVHQVELEDLVVQVDEELSMQPDSLALWNQRVGLLMDLEQLYRNRLRREYEHLASL